MSMTALAAFLKAFLWPVMAFTGLLITRWIAIVILRLMPESKLRRALFDKRLLERKWWIQPTVTALSIVALFAYVSTFA